MASKFVPFSLVKSVYYTVVILQVQKLNIPFLYFTVSLPVLWLSLHVLLTLITELLPQSVVTNSKTALMALEPWLG